MQNSMQFKPTQSHRVPEADEGGGRTDWRRDEQMGDDGLWQWNQASRGQEQHAIHHELPRQIWKDSGRRAQEQGSKGEAKWGRNEKASGRVGSGSEQGKVTGCRSCASACMFPTLGLDGGSWWDGGAMGKEDQTPSNRQPDVTAKRPETFQFRMKSWGHAENKPPKSLYHLFPSLTVSLLLWDWLGFRE